MSWCKVVETLVDTKDMEEVSRDVGGGSTTPALPEQCVKIVGFSQDYSFSDVE